jgi:hypothetical protein
MLSRRNFLLSAALVAGGAVTGIYLFRSNAAGPGEQAINGLIDKLVKLPGAVRFGEMYRKQKNNNVALSVKLVSDRLHKTHGDLRLDNIDIALEKQIQTELRTNQVYLVDDWYLTRTEAELCSLASLKKES